MSILASIASSADALLERMDAAMDFLFFPKGKAPISNDEIEVNGVVLPRIVAAELKRQGVALSNYSAAELKAAVRACANDARLIDDEHGTSFFDKLELTDQEKRRQSEKDEERHPSFRDKILKEREEKKHVAEESMQPTGCCG